MPTRFDDDSTSDFSKDNDAFWDLLNLYADGEASPVEAAQVEEFLKSDAAYAKQLAFVRTTSAAVHSFTEMEPPASLREAILGATTHRVTLASRLTALRACVLGSLTPRHSFSLSLAGLAAAGLLAVAVVQHSGRNRVDPQSTTTPREVHDFALVIPPAGSPSDRGYSILPSRFRPSEPQIRRGGPPTGDSEIAYTALHVVKHELPGPKRSLQTSDVAVKPHNDETASLAQPATYRPNMDEQNQRSYVASTTPDTSSGDFSGPAVHTADMTIAMPPTRSSDGPSGDGSAPETPHVIVAKLPALPPEPNQVLTRGDMARNKAAMNSGYDRSTLRSLERKEASISLLRGTF